MKDMYFNGETDEDFDNLNPVKFVKNTIEKIKKIDSVADVFRSNDKIDCIDDKKSSGSSNSDAREGCREELGGNIFVRGAKKIGLNAPRGAFLLLVKVNYRGIASRINTLETKDPSRYQRAINKFSQLGGSKDEFLKAIRRGKNLEPKICGNKCQGKIDSSFDGGGSSNVSNDEMALFKELPDYEFLNLEPTITIAIISLATAILTPIIKIVGTGFASKKEKEADNREANLFVAKENAKINEENRKKSEESEGVGKKIIIGSSILVVILIGTVIAYKIKKRKNK